MGCHTWFYNKVKDASAEDLKMLKERLASKFEHYYDYPTLCQKKEKEVETLPSFKKRNAFQDKKWRIVR